MSFFDVRPMEVFAFRTYSSAGVPFMIATSLGIVKMTVEPPASVVFSETLGAGGTSGNGVGAAGAATIVASALNSGSGVTRFAGGCTTAAGGGDTEAAVTGGAAAAAAAGAATDGGGGAAAVGAGDDVAPADAGRSGVAAAEGGGTSVVDSGAG